MSDYCGKCRYDVKRRLGPDACPFNALYWDFLARNTDKLAGNQRLAMPYRNWAKMTAQTQADLRASAASFLDRLDGTQVER
jgi:deoxyribodipyrimidine photolyase-related protein